MVCKADWTSVRTGILCVVTFYLCYGFGVLKEVYYERQTIRNASGLKPGDYKRTDKIVTLGPHSYMTLILSIGVTAIILFFIWLIVIIPFSKLFTIAAVHNLFINSPERQDDDHEYDQDLLRTSSRDQILDTCAALQTKMEQLERKLAPLADSLQLLAQIVEAQKKSPIGRCATQSEEKNSNPDIKLTNAQSQLVHIVSNLTVDPDIRQCTEGTPL